MRVATQAQVFRGDVRLRSVCFSPGGRTIAAAGDDGVMRLFDTNMSVSTASLPIGQTRGKLPHMAVEMKASPIGKAL